LAVKSLETVDGNSLLEMSHVGLIEAAFDELQLSKELRKQVITFINAKNADDLRSLCEENGMDADKLTVFTKNYPNPNDAFATVKSVYSSEAVLNALNEFETIYNVLASLGTAVKLIVDFSCIGTMSYYSGVVFKGYIRNIPDAVLSGGQYDKLMRKLNRTAGAIGFAVYLDELGRYDRNLAEYDVDTVLLYGEDIAAAIKTSEMLSSGGNSVLVVKEVPKNIRYRQLLKITEKRLETVNGND
ncbi:MAG: ATP phosphoribosyltransferase regulatory subunit, partial [Clostridia bacterium]|nr:ATP phosphoribosyltransferase regulatory subunit [Clostridia bacterium]